MPDDVTPRQLARQAELWRALSPETQVRVAAQQWVAGRRAAKLSMRNRYPQASEELIAWLVKSLFVGETVAARLYGPPPPR
jgi:hypothetical protein